MIYTLVIKGSPGTSQGSQTAFRFAQATLARGHSIHRVFFYQDGVHHGSALITPPQDETDMVKAWQALGKEHNLDLVVCIAAALRRGVLDQTEADRYERDSCNLASGFALSGLGQLVEATLKSDHCLTFGE